MPVMMRVWEAFHIHQKLDIPFFCMIYGKSNRLFKKAFQALFYNLYKRNGVLEALGSSCCTNEQKSYFP